MPTPDETDRLGIQPERRSPNIAGSATPPEDRLVRLMISVIPGDTIVLHYVVAT